MGKYFVNVANIIECYDGNNISLDS